MWLVLAKNKNDAREKVFQKNIIPMNKQSKKENQVVGYNMFRICEKSELKVKMVEKMHEKDGEVICIC